MRAFLVAGALLGIARVGQAEPLQPVPPTEPAEPVPRPCTPNTSGPVEIEGPGPKVTIELEGPPPDLTLVQNAPPYGWRSVCQAPCTVHAPAGAEYKLRGSGITESESFHVDPRVGTKVRVHVEPISQGALIAGTILIYAGISVMPSGALAIATGYITEQKPLMTVGFVTLGVGAALTGVGLPLFLANTQSEVVVEKSARLDAERLERARSLGRPASSVGFALPVFSGTF